MKSILYYIHDPMCSWCWGLSKALNELLERLPAHVEVRRVLGGLAADTDQVMPVLMQESIKSNWIKIEQSIPSIKFNFDFWEKTIPRRSTYPACRAVIAARLQNDKFDILMTKAIQRAYYHEARNPSDNSTLIELADGIGLARLIFEKDLISSKVQRILTEELELSHSLFAESFPSLILETSLECSAIPIDYNDSVVMLDEITYRLGI